jgi:hypothetical protein
MVTFLIGIVVLWIVWRCMTRSMHVVEIAPPAPTTINVLAPSITIQVHLVVKPGCQ